MFYPDYVDYILLLKYLIRLVQIRKPGYTIKMHVSC